jgi:hypothetical protein
VLCEEVEVQLSEDWPDYVFADDYQLMPLIELERAIRRDKHLPDMPSAEQMAAQGVPVGQMQTKLLQKVEELTLHVIALDKELRDIKHENTHLQERIATLELVAGAGDKHGSNR